MAVCSMLVVFVGVAGAGPGLAGFMNDVEDRVAYTVGDTVSVRNPILPPPSVVCIDDALEEIW